MVKFVESNVWHTLTEHASFTKYYTHRVHTFNSSRQSQVVIMIIIVNYNKHSTTHTHIKNLPVCQQITSLNSINVDYCSDEHYKLYFSNARVYLAKRVLRVHYGLPYASGQDRIR